VHGQPLGASRADTPVIGKAGLFIHIRERRTDTAKGNLTV